MSESENIDLLALKGNANMGLLYNKYFGFVMKEKMNHKDRAGFKNTVYDPTQSKSVFFRLFEPDDGNHGGSTMSLTLLTTQHACSSKSQSSVTKTDTTRLENAIKQSQENRSTMLRRLGFEGKDVTRVYQSDGFFLTGVGSPHPIGNNLQFHPALGTPYLPGSAVKGALKHFIREMMLMSESNSDTEQANLNTGDLALLEHLFGLDVEQDKPQASKQNQENSAMDDEGLTKKDEKSGSYIFFDALPVRVPQYTADVMTPHFGKWCLEGGKREHTLSNTPNDWSDPLPVQFLAVEDIKLEFAIIPKRPAPLGSAERDIQNKELTFLFAMLEQLVEFRGLGAKTRSGYGHFKFINS
ncbi:type III-B CRISPR module RAMP protein Cmr6 [Paraneptunicella aestuarii]|uniref:type III-B CRISPR module RAMP protein Cmr6 n=1 Tax=Paraneptunicella aestuarii TaxID=2831148 RepID=UPI001E52C8B5|nr:type III-B CRISPR module RAMP protein Cmr6 [Paraneptunicella aestuarii]UAA40369.1 type III-B CRISPR module RAMP protein Cmr6 [Paraneptunicella aestuarii]